MVAKDLSVDTRTIKRNFFVVFLAKNSWCEVEGAKSELYLHGGLLKGGGLRRARKGRCASRGARRKGWKGGKKLLSGFQKGGGGGFRVTSSYARGVSSSGNLVLGEAGRVIFSKCKIRKLRGKESHDGRQHGGKEAE